eukprot:6205227-Pleurochrysis_carterae.AAC.1
MSKSHRTSRKTTLFLSGIRLSWWHVDEKRPRCYALHSLVHARLRSYAYCSVIACIAALADVAGSATPENGANPLAILIMRMHSLHAACVRSRGACCLLHHANHVRCVRPAYHRTYSVLCTGNARIMPVGSGQNRPRNAI